jgi:hypothetical protein
MIQVRQSLYTAQVKAADLVDQVGSPETPPDQLWMGRN